MPNKKEIKIYHNPLTDSVSTKENKQPWKGRGRPEEPKSLLHPAVPSRCPHWWCPRLRNHQGWAEARGPIPLLWGVGVCPSEACAMSAALSHCSVEVIPAQRRKSSWIRKNNWFVIPRTPWIPTVTATTMSHRILSRGIMRRDGGRDPESPEGSTNFHPIHWQSTGSVKEDGQPILVPVSAEHNWPDLANSI